MKKILTFFLFSTILISITNISLSIEPDVFIQSTVNRAASTLSGDLSKEERIEELKQIFPNYRFVGICIQPYTDMVIQAQNILNLDLSDQYSFKNFEESSKSWVLTFLNKTIIIDQKSYIIDGFSNLFTNDVEKVLYSN